MNDLLPLRPYQQECVEAIESMWDDGLKRVAAVLPTGAGKTVVFAHLIKRHLSQGTWTTAKNYSLPPGVLVLAHTDELVLQAVHKINAVAPHLNVGVVKAGRDETSADVIVGSVQTLRILKRRQRLQGIGLIVVDECHHSTAKSYRDILEHFGAFDDDAQVRVAGFTATLARGDKAKLSDIWQDVAYRKDLVWMVREGHLLNVRGKRIEVADLDLSDVRKTRGDFNEGDLGEAIEHSMAPQVVAKAYLEHASDRSGVVFTPTVDTAYLMSHHLNAAGIRTEVVHGDLSITVRREILARLASGQTQVVSNCAVLTEGFDEPRVSCVTIARPTRSAPLYQQIVGRALRLYPGQTEALVLDVVGASKVHDLRSLIDLSSAPPETDCTDCTLLDLEEIAERAVLDKPLHCGAVDAIEFDPLVRASRRVWGATKGGTYFLSAGDDAYIFLCPSSNPVGSWDVAWCTKGRTAPRGGFTGHAGVAMDYALAWGEEEAVSLGGALVDTYTAKGRSWRGKRASDKQLGLARQLGLDVSPDIRSGDLSKVIDSHLASARIDPIVSAIVAQRSVR